MATAGFTSGHLDLGGLGFHYTDWGGDGPPLVMLHGLSGHARTWDHTAAALSDRYRVLALDQRGHGDSDWAPQYGIGLMAADLLAFMDALQLREVTLMGLSMGGLVSFVFAAAHPERVRRLMVLDIGPEIAPAGSRNVSAAMAESDVFASEDEAFAQARAANPRPTDETLRHRVRHNLRSLPDGTLTFKYDKAFRSPARRVARAHGRPALGGLEVGALPGAAGAWRGQPHPRGRDRAAHAGREPQCLLRLHSGLRSQHHAGPPAGPARRAEPMASRRGDGPGSSLSKGW